MTNGNFLNNGKLLLELLWLSSMVTYHHILHLYCLATEILIRITMLCEGKNNLDMLNMYIYFMEVFFKQKN